jgi:hypothetical protein
MGGPGMAEVPKQENTDGQAGEKKPTRGYKAKDFISENPAFSLTLLYLYVTAVGFLYSVSLYGAFRINILDYSEVADLLLAAFKGPLILTTAGAQILVFLILLALAKAVARKTRDKFLGVFWTERRLRIAAVIAAVVFVITSSQMSGAWAASVIKDGKTPKQDVWYRTFKGSAGQVTESNLQLIGATQKAVFFYDLNDIDNAKDNRTVVIPQAQIVSIEVSDSQPNLENPYDQPNLEVPGKE